MSNKNSLDRPTCFAPSNVNEFTFCQSVHSAPSFSFQINILEAISALNHVRQMGFALHFPPLWPLAVTPCSIPKGRRAQRPRSPDMIFHVAERILYESEEQGAIRSPITRLAKTPSFPARQARYQIKVVLLCPVRYSPRVIRTDS